jgi:L-arabinose isomerase
VWRSKPDFRTAATAWLEAGASHHTAMTTQVNMRTVRDFAAMTQLDLVVIDDNTTLDGIERHRQLNRTR